MLRVYDYTQKELEDMYFEGKLQISYDSDKHGTIYTVVTENVLPSEFSFRGDSNLSVFDVIKAYRQQVYDLDRMDNLVK